MSAFKPTIALTNLNTDNLSRKDLLEWVNSQTNANYLKIEELSSGIAYCQIMEQLFPNCVGLKKIKTNAKLHHEHLHNLRLLQCAFTRLKFDKTIPIDRIIKGRFQDNLEFLQWFKKFCDNQCTTNGKENIPIQFDKSKMIRSKSCTTINGKDDKSSKINGKDDKSSKISTPRDNPPSRRCVSPASIRILNKQLENLNSNLAVVKADRDFYFKKLTTIEALLKRALERGEDEDFCKRAFHVMYDDESERGPSTDQE